MLVAILITAAALAGAGVYFYQTQIAKQKPVPVVPQFETQTPEAQDSQTSQAGEIDTAGWQIYRNEEYGFEFKYPDFPIEPKFFPENEGIVFPCGKQLGNHFRTASSEHFNPTMYDVVVYSNPQKKSLIGFLICMGNKLIDENNAVDVIIGEQKIIAKSVSYKIGKGDGKTILIARDNIVIVIEYQSGQAPDQFNQMLSTFKFIEPQKSEDLSKEEILEQLKNGLHLCYGFLGKDKVKFTDRIYKQTIEGSAIEPYCRIYKDFVVYGDFDGDGDSDAALVIDSYGGGSGTFFELELFLNNNGTMEWADKLMIGDRAKINSFKVENGLISLDFIGHGQDDPMCCPTQKMLWILKLETGKFKIVG